jgi:Sulphur oxidation protein SoxZ
MVNRVFRVASDIAISEDPSFEFSFRPANPVVPGVITAEILDSDQQRFIESLAASRRCTADVSGSPALQVRFGLGFVQLFDHCLDLRRIAEQPNAPTDPAARLKAESELPDSTRREPPAAHTSHNCRRYPVD